MKGSAQRHSLLQPVVQRRDPVVQPVRRGGAGVRVQGGRRGQCFNRAQARQRQPGDQLGRGVQPGQRAALVGVATGEQVGQFAHHRGRQRRGQRGIKLTRLFGAAVDQRLRAGAHHLAGHIRGGAAHPFAPQRRARSERQVAAQRGDLVRGPARRLAAVQQRQQPACIDRTGLRVRLTGHARRPRRLQHRLAPAAQQRLFPVRAPRPVDQLSRRHRHVRRPERGRRQPRQLVQPPAALAQAVVARALQVERTGFPRRVFGSRRLDVPALLQPEPRRLDPQQRRPLPRQPRRLLAVRQARQQLRRQRAHIPRPVAQQLDQQRLVRRRQAHRQRLDQLGPLASSQ